MPGWLLGWGLEQAVSYIHWVKVCGYHVPGWLLGWGLEQAVSYIHWVIVWLPCAWLTAWLGAGAGCVIHTLGDSLVTMCLADCLAGGWSRLCHT